MKTHFLKNKNFALVGALALVGANLQAQQQPVEAINQQDEIVSINLAANRDANEVLEILRSNDKFETNAYTTRVFELRNTTAYELLLTISQAVATEKGVVRGAVTQAVNGEKARHFLVVTTTNEQMPAIEKTLETLDVPGMVNSQGRSRKALRVKYRRASDLGAVLKGTRLTSQAKILADDLTNTLYYDDSEYVIGKVDEYVSFFDVPIPQIEFDVQIIEVREDATGKLGLDWDAWKRSVGGQFGVTGNWFEGDEQFARLDGLLTLDANVLANFLNYTVQSGTANLVQRSRLTASNLKPAVISDTRRIPFQEYTRSTPTAGILTETNPRVDAYGEADAGDANLDEPRIVTITPPVVNRLSELGAGDEGLLVSIAPVIGTEAVTADVHIAVNSVTGFDQLGKPIVARQDLSNQFSLANGQQVLLGTLERETSTTARSGIPVLKDIPIVQYLFSVETKKNQKSRVFIVANPTFRHVGYDAGTLADAKSSPVLRIEEREIDFTFSPTR